MPVLPLLPADIPVSGRIHPGFPQHLRPSFGSIVHTAPSGREVIGYQRVYPNWEFEILFEVLRDETQNQTRYQWLAGYTELQNSLGFWLRQNGQYGAFIYSNPADSSRLAQPIGIGDNATTAFLIYRDWGFSTGIYSLREPIGILDVRVGATVKVYVNGVNLPQPHNWWIDTDLRTLRLVSPPAGGHAITMDFAFFYFCRFIDDDLDAEMFMPGRWTIKKLRFRSTTPNLVGTTFPGYQIANQNTALTTPQS